MTEISELNRKKLNSIISEIETTDSIEDLITGLNEIKILIQKGELDPLELETNPIFEKIIQMIQNNEYLSLTDAVDRFFDLLGIKIEEIKYFILKLEAKEAISKFLKKYKEHKEQDLIFSKFLVDNWKYPLSLPGLSGDHLIEVLHRFIGRTTKKKRVIIIPDEVNSEGITMNWEVGDKIMMEKALDYFDRVNHLFPITVDNLIGETSLAFLSMEEEFEIYEQKLNKNGDTTLDSQKYSKVSGVECFSYILQLIQVGKIRIDAETNILEVI